MLDAAEGVKGPVADLIRAAAPRTVPKPDGWKVKRNGGEKRVRRNR